MIVQIILDELQEVLDKGALIFDSVFLIINHEPSYFSIGMVVNY